MTQLPQDEFDASMEAAHAWMHAIQERLKVNDNTQGPLAALEARLRETEKICNLQPEGKVKIEKALIKAEALLQCSEEDKKPMILSTLKDLKQKWEETITFITHCHSRIEWVWLHWREHLKAKKEFDLWIIKMRMTLEPDLEMQLGLKEKQWQLDHYVVQLNDISNQKEFLERIIEEAQAFSERTEDPIVPEEARNQMKTDYEDIKTKAQEKVKILAKIAEEHQDYQTSVTEFQKWLNATTEMLNQYTESIKATEFKNEKIKNLQELKSSVSTGEETLNNIDIQANAVMKNTSPLGADKIVRKQKELRRAWEALRDHCAQEEEAQQRILDSERMYMNQARQLESEVADFRKLVQKLRQQLETEGGEESEEELVALWKRYLDISSTLAAEEPRVERLKAQLKELFRFSHDASSVSDNLLSAIKEYQSVKGQAVKLSSGKESELRKLYQDPLREFQRWKPIAHNILESSADITDMAQICFFSQRVEALLSQSCRLKEQLALLQQRKDLLENIFGEEKAGILQTKIAEAAREREFLHNSLSQRSGRLQRLTSWTKEVDIMYKSFSQILAEIRNRLAAQKELQPDLPRKRAQLNSLLIIQEDLKECKTKVKELENLAQSSPFHIQKITQLFSDCQALNRTTEGMILQSKQLISEHEQLHASLQHLQKMLMITRQKLDSYRLHDGEWDIDDHVEEVERLLSTLPEQEIKLHQTEALGQSVIKHTSSKGAECIRAELKHLRDLWQSLNVDNNFLSVMIEGDKQYRPTQVSDLLSSNPPISTSDTEEGAVQRVDGNKASNVDYESSKKRLAAIRTRLNAEKLQPSLPAKRAQFTRLQTIQKDLLDCEAQIGELENLVHSSPSHIQRINQLSSECQALNRTAQTLIQQSEQFISEHEQLHRSLQYLEEILTRTRQNLEYYRNANGDWNIGNRGGEIERLLAVLPEKEVDLHQVEDLGQSVIKNTSPEGASHIQAHLKHLRELWNSLYWLKFSLTSNSQTPELSIETPDGGGPQKTKESLRDRKGQGDYSKLLKEFEEWLRTEDTKLTKILAVRASLSGKELKARREKLKELRRRVVHGQNLFGALLRSHALSQKSEDMEMEDLRYRWMLYKSKLKDTGDLSTPVALDEPIEIRRKRTGKMCSFLYRVCWAALPLQLLLLLLLLLAFLLPLMEESHSCTLANNFARSFNIMLKYEGPPPT
ncbi:nesprin-3 [Latimeria chalumnae]|uniref:nesprin-3 n=1 Tax=Latimeria chalumnae TaxID=7897 RepID=UPI0003C16AA5|nr:PREDICTED: nesprin-3 [Latimeria chalumnae]|eukprot:XP_006003964.1 PREDICTED: nesprin-3 [Latimeria chalumnae]